VCFIENNENGALEKIKFVIEGFNDDTCKWCNNNWKRTDEFQVSFSNKSIVSEIEDFLNEKKIIEKKQSHLELAQRNCNTKFKHDVIQALMSTKPGETLSYSALARKAGHPGAFRAVGNLMRKNPFPIIVPCHRVIASKDIGGYAGNEHERFIDIKKYILKIESKLIKGDGI